MKKVVITFLTISILSKTAYSMPVEDFVNLPHNIMTGVNTFNTITETIKSYKLMLDEYRLMVKNMAAPYFWVFNEVKNFQKTLDSYKEQYGKYLDQATWQNHLESLIDPNAYATSPCFKFGGCSPEETEKMRKHREDMVANAAKTTENFVKRFNELSDEYKKRINILEKIAKSSQQADGALKAAGATNEYLHVLNDGMNALISRFDSFLEAYNAMNMLELENIRKKGAMDTTKENSIKIKVPATNSLFFTDVSSDVQ